MTPNPRRLPSHRWLVALVGATAFAQSTPPQPTEPTAVVLSPFIVDSDADQGYRASSSTSGSRLKTDLKDIAASVSVLTNDFLDDLGATDIASALAFVAGAENDQTTDPTSIGLNQGYLGGDFGDVNTRSGEVRVRGLGRASTAANFVPVIASTDRYNIERAEFLRGANSILFGLSEPAGLISYSTKVAHLRKNISRVETKVDNFGTHRGVLDLSRTLIKDKLAFRGVGLYSDKRYLVDTAYWRDKRLFLTGTYRPFKHTTVRAFAEHTDTGGRRPNYRTSQDNVSGWLALYNQYARVLTPAQLASAFYWDPTVFNASGAPTTSLVTVNGQTTDLGLLRRANDGNANATALFYDNRDWSNPQGNTATITSSRNAAGAVEAAAFRGTFVRSADPLENRPNPYADPQITNRAILPYDRVELGALPGNYRWERGRKLNVTIDQHLAEGFDLSASFQREVFRQKQQFSPIAQQQQVSIDVNVKLPDGRTNPNFLRPYIFGRQLGDYNHQTADNFLVQANYDFDFAKKTSRLGWLGFHRLTSLYTRAESDRLTYRWNVQVDNTIPGVMTAGLTAASRHLYQFWYVGDPVQVGDSGLRLTGFPTTTVTTADRTYNYTYYDAPTRSWRQSPTALRTSNQLVAGGRNFTAQENDGVGASLQSFFWKRKIVTLVGWRQDRVDAFTHTLVSTAEPLTGERRADYLQSSVPQLSNSKATATQSIVFHATNWLRLFGSRSENFAATASRTDSLFRPIAPQNGITKEIGLGLNLFENKLNLRVSAYNSSQNLATSGGAASTASLRVEVVEDQLYNALLSTGRIAEWSTVGPAGVSKSEYNRPLDISATEDSVSKGLEAEVVYNPLPGWRLAFNVSKLDNVSTNVGRELREFLDVRAPFYRKYFQEGLRTDGSTNANPSTATLISTSFANAVAANYVGNILKEGTSNPGISEYTFRLVTNYAFRQGPLKGFSIGANAGWEKGKIVGFALLNTTFNVGGLDNYAGTVSDPNRPFIRSSTLSGGAFAGYRKKIYGDKVMWKIQLNAQNLFGEHGLRQISINPDQSKVWGVAQPRTWELSNSFDF